VSTTALGNLGNVIQLPATTSAGTLSLNNVDLQSAIEIYFTGFLQTNFNILSSLSQIFALASGGFPATGSTGLCSVASQLGFVDLISNQVVVLNGAIQQMGSVLRTCTLFSTAL
jgi:hypothetical protein